MAIDPGTTIGAVHLTVRDLESAVTFYTGRLGFETVHRAGQVAQLGAGGRTLLSLTGDPAAERRRGTTGLYHFAILVPSRRDLAAALRHLVHSGTAIQGGSDHLVSEALYLADTEGNGIEIYRDRPRADWTFDGSQVAMATRPLDLEALLADAGAPSTAFRLPPHTKVGHVHLHVSRMVPAESFYRDLLGFDLMARYGPAAAFVSAGGYHHHVGFNTWLGEGAPAPATGAAGLRWFEVVLPDAAALHAVRARLHVAQVPVVDEAGGLLVRDPSGNGVLLRVGLTG